MSDKLQQAIALIKSGDKVGGKRLLSQVLVEDPRSETAWLWMSGAVDTDQQRMDCLEHILAINPNNQQAQMGLAKLAAASQPQPPVITPPSFEVPAIEAPEFDPFSSEPASIFPTDLGSAFDAPSDSAFASFLSGDQEQGGLPELLSDRKTVEEFDFFDSQGVEPTDSTPHAAPFDDASLEDFFRSGAGSFDSFDEQPAAQETPFGSFGDQSGSPFSFDEPAETAAEPGMDDFLNQWGAAGDDEPAPLPDTFGETPGFFQQEAAQAGAFGGAFTEDAFDMDSAGAFLADDEQALTFEEQGAQVAALESEIARQAPVSAGAPISSSDQRVWADPRSSANRLTVVSVDGILLANPDKKDLSHLKEQIENDEVPDEEALTDSKIIAMERIMSVQARSNDALIRLEYQADDGVHGEILEYSSTALRNEILAELYRMARGKMRRRLERSSLLSTIGAPLGLAIFIFVLTVVCFLGVLGVMDTASRDLTGQLNQAQVEILTFLITHGPTVVAVIGGLAFLGALAWLTWSLLKPTKVVVLRPRG